MLIWRSTKGHCMVEASGPFRYGQFVFVVFVIIVFGTSVIEVVSEFMSGETFLTMADDLSGLVISVLVLGGFAYERRIQQRALRDLGHQLNKARGQLAKIDSRSPELASQYRAVMQKQFDAWSLTASEQDVVIGMLKGLTFREIAELRQTREKTVRQQASAVYRKAGVSSRNELTAWFFEDMLDPPEAGLEAA